MGNKKLLALENYARSTCAERVWPCRLLNSIGFSKGECLALSSNLTFKGTCWGTVIMTRFSQSQPQFFSEKLRGQRALTCPGALVMCLWMDLSCDEKSAV